MNNHSPDNSDFFPATAMPDSDWWRILWPNPSEVLEKLGFTAGITAVDLCCGDGLFTVALCLLPQVTVYAIDLDPDMLLLARKAIAGAGAPSPTWINGDARDLPRLVGQEVDCVLIANTFHGVPDRTGLAQSANTVLKSGGTFVVINWHALPRERTTVLGRPRGPVSGLRMSPSVVAETVAPAGFTLDRLVDLPPYHYGAVFRKPSAPDTSTAGRHARLRKMHCP